MTSAPYPIPGVHVPPGDADDRDLQRCAVAIAAHAREMHERAIGVARQHATRIDLLSREVAQARAFALTVTTENAKLAKEVHELRAELALAREALRKISPDLRNDSLGQP